MPASPEVIQHLSHGITCRPDTIPRSHCENSCSAVLCRNLQYEIAARVFNASEPAAWATGPYLPYPNLNITGHVLVSTSHLHPPLERQVPKCTQHLWAAVGINVWSQGLSELAGHNLSV